MDVQSGTSMHASISLSLMYALCISLLPQRCQVRDSLSLPLKGPIKPSCLSVLCLLPHSMMFVFGAYSPIISSPPLSNVVSDYSVQLFICSCLKAGICLSPLHSACQRVVSTGQLA